MDVAWYEHLSGLYVRLEWSWVLGSPGIGAFPRTPASLGGRDKLLRERSGQHPPATGDPWGSVPDGREVLEKASYRMSGF
jgi:hypothetical protein